MHTVFIYVYILSSFRQRIFEINVNGYRSFSKRRGGSGGGEVGLGGGGEEEGGTAGKAARQTERKICRQGRAIPPDP